MAIVIERDGKTVSDATISACEDLGVPRSEVDVEVLDEGSKGVFGIGSRNAKVRVRVKNENLSQKGLKSKRALEGILSFLIPTYQVAIRENPDRIRLEIRDTNDKGLLIGRRGEMIKSLEYLVGKMGGRDSEDGREKRVSIDIDGYKKKKDDKITELVRESVKTVRKTRKPVSLGRLTAAERRTAYLTLKRESGVNYETKVENDEKIIIIIPSAKGSADSRRQSRGEHDE